MKYFLDTNSIRVMDNYYLSAFSSFWHKMNIAVWDDVILSVDQVYDELQTFTLRPHLDEWVEENKRIFRKPTSEESQYVSELFKVPKFRESLKEKKRLKGESFADPWLIAAATLHKGCVITEESGASGGSKGSSRIPDICTQIGTQCINMEEFIDRNNWVFK